MSQISLEFSDELAEILRQQAKKKGLTVSEYLTDLIRRDVDRAWPSGFFEEVVGRWQGPPCARPPQGDYERHEAF